MSLYSNNIKVSVIIPVYNAEKYIRKCIDSLLIQTLKEIEVICVDDGSNDSSLEILNEYKKIDKRIFIINQENSGTSAARNHGLSLAKGEYVSILDNDDYFDAEMLEKTYKKAKDNDVDICLFAFKEFDDKSNEIVIKNKGLYLDDISNDVLSVETVKNKDIFSITNPASWNKLFRRQFLIDNNIEFRNFRANDIYFTFVSLVLANRITYVREPLLNYRVGLENNLEKNIISYPLNFCEAFVDIKNKLISENKYELIRIPYINNLYNQLLWQFKLLSTNQEIFKKSIDDFKNDYLDKLDILTLKKEEIYNLSKYNRLVDILYGKNSKYHIKTNKLCEKIKKCLKIR